MKIKQNKSKKDRKQTNRPHISVEVNKSTNLLKYLKERIQLRNKAIRSFDQYENIVWLGDIPKSKYCYIQPMIKNSSSNTEEELQEKWIEIKKPKLTNAPSLPKVLEEWLECEDINNPNSIVSLKKIIEINHLDENEEEITTIKKLSDHGYLNKVLKDYLRNKWQPWSEIEKVNRQVQDIYSELYAIYSNQKKLGETFEVLLGVGYLTWKTSSNYEVKRHGVTANITIDFDARRGVITIMPSGVNGFTFFEQDMLDYNEQLHGKEKDEIKKNVNNLHYNVWGSKQVHTTLNSWINYLSSYGKYLNSIIRHKEIQEDPIVSFAPAVILRKRGHRNFINFIDKAVENIHENDSLPDLVKKFILPVNNQTSDKDLKDENENQIISGHDELYFPLPANDQQKKILQELNKKPGILVEGPPGTGKSHTIANISTHLLATGKKVLITSQGVRALKVLKDKFPEEIQSLCINVLGDDFNTLKTLQQSVEDINDRESQWDTLKEESNISKIEKELNEEKKQEVVIIKDLVAIREQETKKHNNIFCNYSGTLAEIAKKVSLEKDKYNWLYHSKESHDDCPITNVELENILHLLRFYSVDQKNELKKNLIEPSILWSQEKFTSFCKEENHIKENIQSLNLKIKTEMTLDFIQNKKHAEELLILSKDLLNHLEILEKKISRLDTTILKGYFS